MRSLKLPRLKKDYGFNLARVLYTKSLVIVIILLLLWLFTSQLYLFSCIQACVNDIGDGVNGAH